MWLLYALYILKKQGEKMVVVARINSLHTSLRVVTWKIDFRGCSMIQIFDDVRLYLLHLSPSCSKMSLLLKDYKKVIVDA